MRLGLGDRANYEFCKLLIPSVFLSLLETARLKLGKATDGSYLCDRSVSCTSQINVGGINTLFTLSLVHAWSM